MAKRNAQGSGSIRKRPNGRWEARYTAGRDPGTGKQIQKSILVKRRRKCGKSSNRCLLLLMKGLTWSLRN